ncbi:endonuclease/exonuclease/phosphatase family protein [Sediminibacillus albus]|uniref:Metal-dependent hydrolase, endonuclease/exonuclease/phosphatase family n=1 Tax=Sediminibacillus albus TaxID=407036 RepID=A0A1G8Y753_9BACI|nr:endonuclease/exonuclease/phosphatase family protein [Sediminibacillus albus]SDJ98581.1 Metal-dependent hydrolase, endonuclease/exonuclease/phosphatase family [Sediminibacillus albus]
MKKKLLFCLVALLAFTITPTSIAAAQSDLSTPAKDVTIKVMTYNIHTGIGTDGNYDLDRIAETIQESDAEVVALQEVDVHWAWRSNFDNQLAYLAEKLDMHAFFAPIYDQDPLNVGEPRRQFGVAVLSKHPILEAENREITRLSTQDSNPDPALAPGFADVRINAKGAKFSFYVTHLDYRADPLVREMQVEDMLNIMPETESVILAGDMNAAPDAPELQPLFQRLQDVWTGEGGWTYPAVSPQKRIDYILASSNLTVSNTEVIQTNVSDHLPVISKITLPRGR